MGIFLSESPFPDFPWYSYPIYDYDGDGKTDILFMNANSGVRRIGEILFTSNGLSLQLFDLQLSPRPESSAYSPRFSLETIGIERIPVRTGSNNFNTGNTRFPIMPDFNGDGSVDFFWRTSQISSPFFGESAVWNFDLDGGGVVDGGFLPVSPTGNYDNWIPHLNYFEPSSTGYSVTPANQSNPYSPTFPNTDPVPPFERNDLQNIDFNGDGKTDIFWEDTGNGSKAMWVMDGPNIVNGGFLPNSPRPEQGWFNWDFGFADFNGDNKTDIAWVDTFDFNETAIWIMDGPNIVNGGFLPGSPRGTNFNQSWIPTFSDFNGDGKSDVFWENINTGENAMWVMDGPNIINGGFLPNSPDGRPFGWDYYFADFNGDNKTDIAWADELTGAKAIWIMDGPNIINGGFLQSSPRVEQDWRQWDFYGADFNGDGKTDTFWENVVTGEKAIWIMDGPNIVDGGFLQSAPRETTQFGVFISPDDIDQYWRFSFGDFNGDGKTDIYWRGQQNEQAIWIMDGPNIVNGGFLPDASSIV